MRLGLALSGGGFRASLFHIGVLARLADLGLLRHVEVISTVSGGAIIGALYYLHLKRLYERADKPDQAISDGDYQEILREIEVSFLAGVQQNIIMRTFANPLRNLLMSRADYSQSMRLAELYDQILYRPVFNPAATTSIRLRDLKIIPTGAAPDFYPLRDNAGRRAKVPILLINATTMNTGRNWRFEAARMGEHPRPQPIAWDIDKHCRLLTPPDYQSITTSHQDFPLGQAVAASACLPGVFNPLPIRGLYTGIQLELVDGGVHDNQGIQGLLDLGCSDFIISDVTKQIDDEAYPDTRAEPLLQRIRSMMADRIREEQLYRLANNPDTPVLFLHLRKNLPVKIEPWLNASDQAGVSEREFPSVDTATNGINGIAPIVQHHLSRLRTHLDSFTEVEAYSLMLAGYRIAEQQWANSAKLPARFQCNNDLPPAHWRFQQIDPWLRQPTPNYLRQLRVGEERFLKTFRLNRTVTRITLTSLLLIVILLIATFRALIGWLLGSALAQHWLNLSISLGSLLDWTGWLIVAYLAWRIVTLLTPLRRLRAELVKFWQQAFIPFMAGPLLWLHIMVFDPIFLKLGRISALGAPPRERSEPSISH